MLMQIYTHVFSARVDDEEDLPTTFLSQKEILSQLQNIFPNQPFEELKNASLSSSDINEAVDNLLNPLTSTGNLSTERLCSIQPCSSSSSSLQVPTDSRYKSLHCILKDYREQEIKSQNYSLTVNRKEIWRVGLTFYKKAYKNLQTLQKDFEVIKPF